VIIQVKGLLACSVSPAFVTLRCRHRDRVVNEGYLFAPTNGRSEGLQSMHPFFATKSHILTRPTITKAHVQIGSTD
jgi:hypothetical protein